MFLSIFEEKQTGPSSGVVVSILLVSPGLDCSNWIIKKILSGITISLEGGLVLSSESYTCYSPILGHPPT